MAEVDSTTVAQRSIRNPAVDWPTARAIAADVTPLGAETVPLEHAAGRRLAEAVYARIDVPHYASSAMDGWAVAGEPPWELVRAPQLVPHLSPQILPGQAVMIVTGGLVPPGTSGILRSEHGTETGPPDSRRLVRNAFAGIAEPTAQQHVRPSGEEARAGERIFPVGDVLSPAHVAVAAACGHDVLVVARRPRVALVTTGTEVVPSGIPNPGQVRDSFGPQLPALLTMMGADVVSLIHLTDDGQRLADALFGLGESGPVDVVITTGGTGASDADHLHRALAQCGATVLVDGVAMRPGAPSVLARLPTGVYVVGLPGNPLAAIMGLLTIAQPLLDALADRSPQPLDDVVLGEVIPGAPGRTSLVPFGVTAAKAEPLAWRGSGMLRGLAAAQGVLVVPPRGAAAGERVPFLPLPWRQWPG